MKTWNCIGTNEDGEIVWFYTFRNHAEAQEFREYAKSMTSDFSWQIVRSEDVPLAAAKQDLRDSLEEYEG